MVFEVAFGPDYKISAGNFFADGHLRGDSRLDLGRRPAAGQEALAAGVFRTGHANYFVEVGRGAGFIQKRNHDNGDMTILAFPGFNLCEPALADSGMENGLKLISGDGILKNNIGEFIAAQLSVRRDDFVAKNAPNFSEGRLAGLDEFAGEMVGVHNPGAVLLKKFGGGGFAHTDTTGEAK
jgi:hypothetical protein